MRLPTWFTSLLIAILQCSSDDEKLSRKDACGEIDE
jgi:hypothetical protein